MRIVISIPMEKNRDSHFCKNRAALVCYSTFRTLLCRCSFLIKYVKYDSMVNKKYNVCVFV